MSEGPAIDGDDVWHHHAYAQRLARQNRLDDEIDQFNKALAIAPDHAASYCDRGNAEASIGRLADARASYDKALELQPDLAEAWLGRGNVLLEYKNYSDARAAFERALTLMPDLAEAWLGIGNVDNETKQYDDARAAYNKALTLIPDLAEAWLGLGNCLFASNDFDGAVAAFDEALRLAPDLAEARLGRGNVLLSLRQYEQALTEFDAALMLAPDLAEAWLGVSSLYADLGRHDDALPALNRALALAPGFAKAWSRLGRTLFERRQLDDALIAYDNAFNIEPDLKYLESDRLHLRQHVCDWTRLEEDASQLQRGLRSGRSAIQPFNLLGMASSAADQRLCAERYVGEQPSFTPLWRGEVYRHDRIRVAYLSSDFGPHPVTYLMAGLFEAHDASHFETTALSIGPDDASDLRRRLKAGFETFIDAELQSDLEVAQLIRRLEIDIVVDLNGHTGGARPNILARRPAPVQLSYLGYPGTTGAGHIDYILADATAIPEDQFAHYSESVVWLPDSFMAFDRRMTIAPRTPTRAECGLPDAAFVFCCFNNGYKITPDLFGVWMRLLRNTDNSVLWLIEPSPTAAANLRREARRHGVSGDRLVFSPKVDLPDHLARQRQANLFLDTLPYNAGMTAASALWAGLPVVTCLGATLVGRMGASLLRACGLPELVTASLPDYEALALRLARDPGLIAALRDRLRSERDRCRLFDTERFARHIEIAYTTMWRRSQSGQRPERFVVDPLD